MRYAEMRKLPRRAGVAELEFLPPDKWETPRRDGKTIVLPRRHTDEIFLLQDERQFLLHTQRSDQHGNWENYFGGTDENPFLVRLNDRAFAAYARDGEAAFYDALKPDVIKRLENVRRMPAVRQGDFFAMPLGHGWDTVIWAAELFGHTESVEPRALKDWKVNGTRHVFQGTGTPDAHLHAVPVHLVEGTLQAPDHEDRKLMGQVYLLVQAKNLADPKNAD